MDEIIESVNLDYSDKDYDGVLIKTNKQEVKLLISNGQSCCEDAGYIVTDDVVGDVIGAKVLDITLTDKGLRTNALSSYEDDENCSMVFCTVKTDKGDIQFAAYNSHNGYYGHTVIIKSQQVSETEYV